ncbi:MAG: hypothetical protein WCQ96_02935 [Patescibacteria group bacterium]
MAENYRMINTKIWLDSYIRKLDKQEDRLFVYFLTNEHANILGIYELPIDVIMSETRNKKTMVENALKKFENDEKIYYRNGYIFIKNFLKYQSTGSPMVKKGVLKRVDELPENIKTEIELILGKKIKKWIQYTYNIYTVGDTRYSKGKLKEVKEKLKVSDKEKERIFSLLDFFKSSFRGKFKTDPALDEDEAIEIIESKVALFENQVEVEKFITAYFNSDKGEEYGYTLSACFTDHTINLFKTGKLNQTSIDCDA